MKIVVSQRINCATWGNGSSIPKLIYGARPLCQQASFFFEVYTKTVLHPIYAIVLGNDEDRLIWLELCSSVCFLRLQMINDDDDNDKSTEDTKIDPARISSPLSWHQLTDPVLDNASDYDTSGELRRTTTTRPHKSD